MLMLIRPDTGELRIDGRAVNEVLASEWRHQAAYVPQDVVLLDASIRENLKLYVPDATDEPLAGRIFVEGRAPLQIAGAIRGEDRRVARVEIPAGWLSPGRYIVEVRTTERTHFPIRRYPFAVR